MDGPIGIVNQQLKFSVEELAWLLTLTFNGPNFCQLCIAPFQKILKLFKILQIRKQLQVFVFFLSNLTEIQEIDWKKFLLAFIRIHDWSQSYVIALHGGEFKNWLLIKIVQNYDNILMLPTYCKFHWYELTIRRPVGSTDQAYPNCFYLRIWWILILFFCPLHLLHGLRSTNIK